jgi:hypothetical protein
MSMFNSFFFLFIFFFSMDFSYFFINEEFFIAVSLVVFYFILSKYLVNLLNIVFFFKQFVILSIFLLCNIFFIFVGIFFEGLKK